jgi:uncharacterized protein (DUF4415 family)
MKKDKPVYGGSFFTPKITPELLARLDEATKNPAAYEPDEDTPEYSDEEIKSMLALAKKGRPRLSFSKKRIKLFLEPDTIEHLRASGKDWQTRLREYVEQGVKAGLL